MKIGILTFQYAFNYGGLLQAYALKYFINKNNNTVEILNYDSSYLYKQNRSFFDRTKTFIWNGFRKLIGGEKKIKKMDRFRKDYLELNDIVLDNHKDLSNHLKKNDISTVIVGSDQVWNPEINGEDSAYILNIDGIDRKIAYAASFGKSSITKEWMEVVKCGLKSFSAVSVREATAIEILKKAGYKNKLKVVVDPVFLLSNDEWMTLFQNNSFKEEKYVLCYIMPGDKILEKRIVSLAHYISKLFNYKVFIIGRKEYYQFLNDGKDLIDIGPNDFIGLINGAEYIITNSFHGTAFSIIFEKNFYSVLNSGLCAEKQLGSRINDLLLNVGLESRLITNENKIAISAIDYSLIKENIKAVVLESKDFLLSALQ